MDTCNHVDASFVYIGILLSFSKIKKKHVSICFLNILLTSFY